jgi:hypothetical protein
MIEKDPDEIGWWFGNVRAAIGYSNDYQTNIADADLNKIQMEIARLRKIEEALKFIAQCHYVKNPSSALGRTLAMCVEHAEQALDGK